MPPTEQEARDAAKKTPASRTTHEQWLVDHGSGSQAVRNADHKAREQQRVYGK